MLSLLANCSQRSDQRIHTRLARIDFARTETAIRLDEKLSISSLNMKIQNMSIFAVKLTVLKAVHTHSVTFLDLPS